VCLVTTLVEGLVTDLIDLEIGAMVCATNIVEFVAFPIGSIFLGMGSRISIGIGKDSSNIDYDSNNLNEEAELMFD
jgi:hypothetical protein